MYDDEISKLNSIKEASAMTNNDFLDPETDVQEINDIVDPA